jgi:CRISPR type III-B/RAMP module-associated protein Cmr5
MIKTESQNRAIIARKVFEKRFNSPVQSKEIMMKKYFSVSKNLPALVKRSGLFQTLSFYNHKNDDVAKNVIQDIFLVLKEEQCVDTKMSFQETIENANLLTYMHISSNVISICVWLSRFSEKYKELETASSSPLQESL